RLEYIFLVVAPPILRLNRIQIFAGRDRYSGSQRPGATLALFVRIPGVHWRVVRLRPFTDVRLLHPFDRRLRPIGESEPPVQPNRYRPRYEIGTVAGSRFKAILE